MELDAGYYRNSAPPVPKSGIKYFSVPELFSMLEKRGFEIKIFTDFPAYSDTSKDKLISLIKQIAVREEGIEMRGSTATPALMESHRLEAEVLRMKNREGV